VTFSGRVRAKRSLGQHFLTDRTVARRIVDALGAGDMRDVLEVGCGMGALTQYLLLREDITLYGVEVDRESAAYLRTNFQEFAQRLAEEDFLRMDIAARFPDGVRIIGNFPYNISSQILFRIIAARDCVPEVVGMVQHEVAQRIAGAEGSRDCGILSVLLQAWYDVEYLFTVGEGAFNPPPKVKSAVIRLKRNAVTDLGCDWALFVRVVKAAFGQRRKMLRNALRAAFGNMGGREHPFFTLRAEALNVKQFVELTNWIQEQL
jgi:16S rRNA (adenine1518-N6/adenine1519-N6)-dimethyltransferase